MTASSPERVSTFGAERRSVSLLCASMCRIIETSALPRNAFRRINWSLYALPCPEMWLLRVERYLWPVE